MEGRKTVRSYHIPAGPLAHELSPLCRMGYGLSKHAVQEISLSSAWLWKSSSHEALNPRFSIGFPEEWHELSQHLKTPSQLSVDLWIFRNLTQDEMQGLKTEMELNKNMRVILAANHLMDWKGFLCNDSFPHWAKQDRAFLSFLPSQQDLDPFLNPQEVLWELEVLDAQIPILITEFANNSQTFYQTLRAEDHPLLTSGRKPLLFRVFKSLEFWGFGHLILALEALLGFLLHGQWSRLGQFVQRLFSPPEFVRKACHRLYYRGPHRLIVFFQYKTEPFLLWVYHRLMRPSWTWLRYQWIEKWFASPATHLWIFLRHRLFPVMMNWIWYQSLFRVWNLLRHQVLGSSWLALRHRAWPAFLQIAWYKSLLPLSAFLRHRFYPLVLRQPLEHAWIFLRHRLAPQVLKWIWFQGLFKLWILSRYKSIPALLWILYPARKAYWILDHEFEKRIRKRIQD